MAPKWRVGSVLVPEGLTCDLASLLLHVTGWHCGTARPSPVTLNALSSIGGCIIV